MRFLAVFFFAEPWDTVAVAVFGMMSAPLSGPMSVLPHKQRKVTSIGVEIFSGRHFVQDETAWDVVFACHFRKKG